MVSCLRCSREVMEQSVLLDRYVYALLRVRLESAVLRYGTIVLGASNTGRMDGHGFETVSERNRYLPGRARLIAHQHGWLGASAVQPGAFLSSMLITFRVVGQCTSAHLCTIWECTSAEHCVTDVADRHVQFMEPSPCVAIDSLEMAVHK